MYYVPRTRFIGTASSGQSMVAGAGAAVASGFTSPRGSAFGGLVGGGLSNQLQGNGMSDSAAGIVGGTVGGAAGGFASGFLANTALKSAAHGGLAGLAGSAATAGVVEALRFGNDCSGDTCQQ